MTVKQRILGFALSIGLAFVVAPLLAQNCERPNCISTGSNPFAVFTDGTARLVISRAGDAVFNSSIVLNATRVLLKSTADKLFSVTDNADATGVEISVGTPTLGTCTAGALTSGSHNFAGEITGNTSGSCIVTFGSPSFTNTPICFAMSRTSTTHPRISAASASSITITGGVSGEAIGYHCDGRIGT